MPSILSSIVKREAEPPVPEISLSTKIPEIKEPELLSESSSFPPLMTTEIPGDLQKHIFGNKKYHPSHGRTTPFPEPGIIDVVLFVRV